MLIITRKPGDSLILEVEGQPDIIEIKLLENGSQMKLGVSAPAGCKVWRSEIYQTILENRQAAASPQADLQQMISRLPKDR